MPGLLRVSSNTSMQANEQDESAESGGSGTQPRTVRRSRSSFRNMSASATLSTSYSQRGPARSFVSQSNFEPPEPAHYSSTGVREQTAELASRALFDSDLTANANLKKFGKAAQASSSQRSVDGRRYSSDDARPDIIEETSEPSTRENTPDQSLANRSALSDLLRREGRPGSASDGLAPTSTRDTEGDSSVIHTEHTPLLSSQDPGKLQNRVYGALEDVEDQPTRPKKPTQFQRLTKESQQRIKRVLSVTFNPKSWSARSIWQHGVKEPISFLPCVFLGVLLNVLDALSYGMILFPLSEPLFAKTGPDGISMFYISCIVSQLVFSSGGSIFKGAVGSEMIEVVPFFHKMTYSIMAATGNASEKTIFATVITAYAMSSILTGVVFFALGAFKLGSLVSFFPRHILIGCIGGVGFFLFLTGIEVSARIEGNLTFELETAKALFRGITPLLWLIPLALSIVLLVLKRFFSSPFIVPGFFVAVAALFYIVAVAVPSLHVSDLRDQGWIFPQVEAGVPFYHFYSYYDFKAVDWKALGATVPAMFALTFFGILHVPINIPALGIAAQEDDLNLNRELVAHGFSNAISGFCGSIQNYLVYVNSEMFISNGGNSRVAGFMLAAATFGVLIAGPDMIGYVPVMVVGALIYYLGIALLEEALVDTWGKMHRLEYLTVVAIVLIMGVYDFVAGILAGIVLACLNFVVQTSQKSAIRASYTGDYVQSTVRRHAVQRDFLNRVGHQVCVMKLAGYLFFGSIVRVEKKSRALIDEESWRHQPISYLIFDLQHVNGLDYSAAEAFTRLDRILARRGVQMIFSGVDKNQEVGKSLRGVGLWTDDSNVEFFETLNMGLEFCENELLASLYTHGRNREQHSPGLKVKPEQEEETLAAPEAGPEFASPRRSYLHEAATTVLDSHSKSTAQRAWSTFKQPLPLILQTFQSLSDKNQDFWFLALPFFMRREYHANTMLYERGDAPKTFFLLYSGILKATYTLPVGIYQEPIVAGTTCGELPFFSNTARTASVVAETDCVCWVLDGGEWERMQREWPEGAKELLTIALRLTVERMESVTSYVLTTAG